MTSFVTAREKEREREKETEIERKRESRRERESKREIKRERESKREGEQKRERRERMRLVNSINSRDRGLISGADYICMKSLLKTLL